MKNSITIILALFLTVCGIGQTSRDVIYLRNGSIVKGKITEMNPTENLKIQTADGSLFVYSMSEIQKMEKEEFVGREMNQETSSVVSQEAIDSYFNSYLSQKRPDLKFVGVSKKNGVKKEVYGQKVYEIEYELIMEAKRDIYVNTTGLSAFATSFNQDFSYTLQNTSGHEAAFTGSKDRIQKGQRIVANGTISFEETDNGWRAKNFRNANFKTVSSNYITPEMAEKIEKERKIDQENNAIKREKQTEIKKQNGEWSQNDISEINFTSIFLRAENVPMFNSIVYKFSVNKLTNNCENCRNDNLAAIQDAIFEALENTNRYSNIDETHYKKGENIGRANFIVADIVFDYKTEYDENGRGSEGYTCKITYGIATHTNLKNPELINLDDNETYFATTKTGQYYTSKASAFEKALAELKDDLESFVYKYNPIELELVRLEVDKRGKVDKVILRKPVHFFYKDKMEFVVLKKGDIVLNGEQFSLENKIAKCTFKGDMTSNEIICEVSGNQNKKALGELVQSIDSIIAINISK